ncbi:APC family permease [Clostridium magnum]|uniref:Putative amino acid permease YhdG n=1 Tax=Clostridium magnum DSM 2767 TaxID=1121326 RepID=A0A162QVD5_9CLOT|nr:APC family permease [Clostridium magnum]KZL89019.1 putative amino acid permease YhdG [Clostridium magnum DSM 2767]SHI23247.1 amino acid/polyamine/organocation transporter, APC superfamily (TC 2.A.3) [Clostridium magnum DSM 2767]
MENNKLQKDHLTYLETIALSVAIMAPTAAMALNVSLMASVSSYSISLVFIIATVVIGCVSVAFIKFNQHFSTAGSVYTFTEKSLGKKVGFISGWLLFLTYMMFTAASAAEVGAFMESVFSIAGIKVSWIPIALLSIVGIWVISYMDVKLSTRIMLIFEGISILLILVLAIVVLFKVGTTTGLSLAPFKINGNGGSSIALAVVFGFMSFAGFEGASSLGEETKNPKKLIPLAILSAVFATGLFYLLISYIQVIGFGINPEGIKGLASSASPLGDLSSKFISDAFAIMIMLGAALSAFSCALGSASAGSRMLFSMSRDGNISAILSKVHPKYKSPYVSLNIIMAVSIVLVIVMFKNTGAQVFGYLGTIAVLALLLAYLLTTIGALVYFTKIKVWKGFNLVAPGIAVVVLSYTFYSNIYPVPAYPVNLFPYIVLAWIAAGIFILAKNTSKDKNSVKVSAMRLEE